MASLNKVLLIGNLTRDPELRYTPQGGADGRDLRRVPEEGPPRLRRGAAPAGPVGAARRAEAQPRPGDGRAGAVPRRPGGRRRGEGRGPGGGRGAARGGRRPSAGRGPGPVLR